MDLWKYLGNIKNFFLYFCNEASIHGLKHWVKFNHHYSEIVLWIAAVFIAATCAVSLSLKQWDRYTDSPTVVALEKNYRDWRATLAAISGCFHNKMDERLAEKLVQETWGRVGEEAKYYLDYIKVVTNASLSDVSKFDHYGSDPKLNAISMLEIVRKVHPRLDPHITVFDPELNVTWNEVVSEFGLCFTFNSVFSLLQSGRKSRKKIDMDKKPISCGFGNQLCYIRIDIELGDIKFHVHSPYEMLTGTSVGTRSLQIDNDYTMVLKVLETGASQDIRKVTPLQRKCYFPDEPSSPHVPLYSASTCQMQCRLRLALRLCACRPFFYHFIDEGPVCDVAGMACLARTSWPKEPKGHSQDNSTTSSHCACFRPCTELSYNIQSQKMTSWTVDTEIPFVQRVSFRWELLPPKLRLRRDVLFSFEDLVVSLGGAAGLLLGGSFLSFAEIIYIILRYFFIIRKQQKTQRSITN